MKEVLDGSAQATLEEVVLAIHDARVIRYITAVGMVLMLYDHILTFADEASLVWKARPSFAKHFFLINRYAVAITQVSVAVIMNHFGFDSLSKRSCQGVVTIAFLLGVTSNACANVLVILRVVTLWDRDRRVAALMALGFCASYFASLSILISILHDSFGGFQYVVYVHTCTTILESAKLPALWASVLVLEVLVLLSVIFNALSRPRSQATPLRRALYRDGIFFFASSTALQTLNLVLSVAARPTLRTCSVFFVWALTTLILNRSLLNIHKATPSSHSSSICEQQHILHRSFASSHLHCTCANSVQKHTGKRAVLSVESISTEELAAGCLGCSYVDVPVQLGYAERVSENRRGQEYGYERDRGYRPARADATEPEIELESLARGVH